MTRPQLAEDISQSQEMDMFDAYEQLPPSYFADPRWNEVSDLRAKGEHARANGLTLEIRASWGFEG